MQKYSFVLCVVFTQSLDSFSSVHLFAFQTRQIRNFWLPLLLLFVCLHTLRLRLYMAMDLQQHKSTWIRINIHSKDFSLLFSPCRIWFFLLLIFSLSRPDYYLLMLPMSAPSLYYYCMMRFMCVFIKDNLVLTKNTYNLSSLPCE